MMGGAQGLVLYKISGDVAVAVVVAVVCGGVTCPTGLHIQPDQQRKFLVVWDIINL